MKRIHLSQTDSTNRYAASQTVADGESLLVTADYQTAGRGQGTNSWESAPGQNLTFSLLIRPRFMPVRRQFLLSEAEALGIKEVLDRHTDGITLKWPNDIYWHDRKLGGTLIETTLQGGAVRTCIFGTGINVNQDRFLSDAPNPVSLRQILGRDLDREALLADIIAAIGRNLQLLQGNQFADIAQRYHAALYRRTGFHAYRDAEGTFRAAIVEVEDDGHLILRDEQGRFRSYAFKEVEFLPAADQPSQP